MKALVLAAGMGSRIRSVAGDLPKPLLPFGGASILAHNLRWLASAGVRDVFINLHYGADAIRAEVGDGSAFGLNVRYLFEPALLGTAGALANLGQAFDATMLVVYGDNLLRCDLDALIDGHRAAGAEATLALFDQGAHVHTGIAGGRVEIADDGAIVAFTEGEAARSPLVNAGVYAVEPSILDLIETGRLVDFGRKVFPQMLAAGRSLRGQVIETDGFCLGLDTPASHAEGQRLLAEGRIVL
ncbi:nucleotidyltransferase family protein [Caulobacter hibisci]|uniref:Nucleotidyltransferase family protein n=1 Tax=Caulobacter hibisci TaxID=2035993 RepID=A0ABS0ST66_9CAUL|nr:nucleotidyltransferase family protein [Caulobacter hibisci]MBI1682819.1 nucleotidyltransferase family protein [Caulobacter hibisci]